MRKHGIIADGDIIRLKIKCKGDTDIGERKKEMKSMIEFGTTSRTTFSTPKAKKTKRPPKKKTSIPVGTQRPHDVHYQNNFLNSNVAMFSVQPANFIQSLNY